jgi:hypothetical protein
MLNSYHKSNALFKTWNFNLKVPLGIINRINPFSSFSFEGIFEGFSHGQDQEFLFEDTPSRIRLFNGR